MRRRAVFFFPGMKGTEALGIALGGALGSVARHGVSVWLFHRLGPAFPYGTLVVNLSGSLVIGVFAALCGPGGRWEVSLPFWQFAAIGICGGYTTFSSFSLQTLELWRRGEPWAAGGNVLVSVVGCLAAVALGFGLGSLLNRG